jgi:hypothetical protein
VDYHLTSDDIASRATLLNGMPVALDAKGKVPALNGEVQDSEMCAQAVTVAPISVAFIAMYGDVALACAQ